MAAQKNKGKKKRGNKKPSENGDWLTQHLNFSPGSYLDSTRNPIYILIFLLPFIGMYEAGTLLSDRLAQTQVVTFSIIIKLAQKIGIQAPLAWMFPGFAVVIILLCWQLNSTHPWKVKPKWLAYMTLESALLSLPLFALSALLNARLFQQSTCCSVKLTGLAGTGPNSASGDYATQIFTSIGAGIYEELVFRFILLGLLLVLMQNILKAREPLATLIAILVSALIFSAHHYRFFFQIGSESYQLNSFLFRTLAGMYFAFVIRYRGYGITAGTHSFYNIILYSFLYTQPA